MSRITPELTKLVRKIVQDKTAAGEMFTAFDVTKVVQSGGVRERHFVVKSVVHDLFSNGDMPSHYTRQLITLYGSSAPAPWLYLPIGSDATQYVSPTTLPAHNKMTVNDFYQVGDSNKAATNTPTQVRTQPVATPVKLKNQPDAREVIAVPSWCIHSIQATVRDKLYVDVTGGCLKITKTPIPQVPEFVVNTSFNIRVGKSVWGKAFGDFGTFIYEADADAILVKRKP
jgi:hypothetical protein